MADNIAGVIQGTTRFVTAIKQSEQVPEKYILVTFSDPGLWTKHCDLKVYYFNGRKNPMKIKNTMFKVFPKRDQSMFFIC